MKKMNSHMYTFIFLNFCFRSRSSKQHEATKNDKDTPSFPAGAAWILGKQVQGKSLIKITRNSISWTWTKVQGSQELNGTKRQQISSKVLPYQVTLSLLLLLLLLIPILCSF